LQELTLSVVEPNTKLTLDRLEYSCTR